MSLRGRVALVTGGAKGIGLAVAHALGAAGASVVVADVDAGAAAAAAAALAAAGVPAAGVHCDVGSRPSVDAAVAAAVARFGGLHVAVANAGIVRSADFLDMTEDDFGAVLRVNLTGVFHTGQAAARHMAAHGGGAIVNMSSVNGSTAIATIAGYNAAKGGVDNLTRCMALSLAPRGIRVNAVAPGSIMTDMLRAVAGDAEVMGRLLSRTPLLRAGRADEVAAAVRFLASDEASYITGEVLRVDGGRSALNYTVPVPPEALAAAEAQAREG